MYRFDTTGQMTMLDLDTAERGGAPPKRRSRMYKGLHFCSAVRCEMRPQDKAEDK